MISTINPSIHPGAEPHEGCYSFFPCVCVSQGCHHASKSGIWIMYHHQLGLPNLPDLLWKWFDSWCLKENLEIIPSGEPIFQLLDGKVWKHCLSVCLSVCLKKAPSAWRNLCQQGTICRLTLRKILMNIYCRGFLKWWCPKSFILPGFQYKPPVFGYPHRKPSYVQYTHTHTLMNYYKSYQVPPMAQGLSCFVTQLNFFDIYNLP